MRVLGLSVEPRQVLYLLGDVQLALLALLAARSLRFGAADAGGLARLLSEHTGAACLSLLTWLLCLYVVEAYDSRVDFRRRIALLRLWGAVGVALVMQMVLFYLLPHWWQGRGVAFLAGFLFAALLSAWRPLVSALQPRLQVPRRTLILGGGPAGRALAEVLRDHPDADPDRPYDLAGFIEDDPAAIEAIRPGAVLGGPAELEAVVAQHHVDCILVVRPEALEPGLARRLLALKARGLGVEDLATVYPRLTGKVPVYHLSEAALLFGPRFAGVRGVGRAAQRLVDVVLSGAGLLLAAPLLLGAAIAIKRDSPGPVFFTQERVGLGERPFTIIKLRTMAPDAEARTGPVWSQGAADMRVTRVGRFLRRSRLDELPQLWNVLRGDMAIVGPRPERAFFIARLKEQIPFYALRFAVKPGLTGWAQVRYRYGASEEDAAEKLCYELYAIRELTVALYLLILLKTVQTVLVRPGS